MAPEELRALIAEGKAIIPCNKLHTSIVPNAIGSMLKTKINVNLGTSRDWKDIDMELEKVRDAVNMGQNPLWISAPLVIHRSPQKADRRVSCHDWNRSDL